LKTKDWIIFWLLGIIWGTSFLWIKIAVADVSPLVLVGFRALFAALGLGAIVLFQRGGLPGWPELRRRLPDFLVLGLSNIAFPWVLISWGEQYIDSGIASILNSAMPLFALIIAPLMIPTERITLPKLAGLLTGFLGVILLMLPSIRAGWSNHLLGMGACVLATVFYAFGTVYARIKNRGLSPQMAALLQHAFGSVIVWLAAFGLEGRPAMPTLPITWLALLWLGLLGSCLAYIIYFDLLARVGITRVSLVLYVPPLVGVLLGVFFLQEAFYWQAVLGALLILSGISIVNLLDRPAAAQALE